MNLCEICFRRTHSFVVKVRMSPSDYDSFFCSPNWCFKFIPNDSAPIRTKFSFSPNHSVPLRAQSQWFRRAFKRTEFRMIRKQISHSHGITRNHFHSEWVRNLLHRKHRSWQKKRKLPILLMSVFHYNFCALKPCNMHETSSMWASQCALSATSGQR